MKKQGENSQSKCDVRRRCYEVANAYDKGFATSADVRRVVKQALGIVVREQAEKEEK